MSATPATVYRALCRLGRAYDANPALKALIAAPELMREGSLPPGFHAVAARSTKVATPVSKLTTLLRHRFLNDAPFFHPLDNFSLLEEVQVRWCGAPPRPHL